MRIAIYAHHDFPNFLAPSNVSARRSAHKGIVLGWIGWIDHQADWDRLGLAEIVDALLRCHEELVFEYSACRSDVKLKEYAIAGVPWLASDVGPYRALGEDQGGRLVRADGWYDAINALVRDRRGRRKLAKRGRRWAQKHTLAADHEVWEDMLHEAIEVAHERRTTSV